MCKPKNLGLLALIKRSGRLSLKACDAQNLGHNRPHVVGFPIRGFGGGFIEDFEPEAHDVPLDAILNNHGVVWPV